MSVWPMASPISEHHCSDIKWYSLNEMRIEEWSPNLPWELKVFDAYLPVINPDQNILVWDERGLASEIHDFTW